MTTQPQDTTNTISTTKIENPIILYVEDDRLSRMVIEVLFKEVMDIQNVTIFEDSANFLDKAHALEEQPNLVFLDIQMKPYSGYQVLEMIRNDEQFENTTVIALTANVMAHDVDQLKAAGFNGLIGKPVMEEVFPQLVDMIVNGDAVWYIP